MTRTRTLRGPASYGGAGGGDGGGTVDSVVAGDGIDVDSSTPSAPIVSVDGVEIDELAAATQTTTSWNVPVSQAGTLVKVVDPVVTRLSRVHARGDRTLGFEDFMAVPAALNATDATLVGATSFVLVTSGTTGGVTGNGGSEFIPGSIALTTGSTSSTGYGAAGLNNYGLLFIQAETYKFACRVKIPTVTTTGQTFDTYIGFRTGWGTNAVNDGLYFHAKSGNSAGNWFAVNEDDTVTTGTDTDTGVVVDTSFHTFYIHYNGTNVLFYIDGVLKATQSTNKPDALAGLQAGMGIHKTLGTTARTLVVDACEWDLYFPARGSLMTLLSL